MDTTTMRGHLERCQKAWDGAGLMVKAQGQGFMEPMLTVLAGMVAALEVAEHERKQTMMALAVAGMGGDHGK